MKYNTTLLGYVVFNYLSVSWCASIRVRIGEMLSLVSHARSPAPFLLSRTMRRWLATSNEPIPFSRSKARTFRVVDEKRQGNRFAIPLGLISFAALIYVCYFRKEGEVDESVMDYLTRDITEKIPDDRRADLPHLDRTNK